VTSIQEAKGFIVGEEGSLIELVILRRSRGEFKLRMERGTVLEFVDYGLSLISF